jgi:hypothetical protein
MGWLARLQNGAFLEGCLLLRYRYLLLAYAATPDEDASLPVAVACVTPNAAVPDSALFIKDDWEKHISESHRGYVEATLEEWAKVLESNPGEIPPLMLELSVGPFRTVEDGECDQSELITHVEAFLTGVYRRFVSP